jgi:IS30 family transposase
MEEKRQRKYFRLTRAERASIERALDKNGSARRTARDLGRSPASVADEVRRNRTVCKGPGKGEQVEGVPEGACPRLGRWPWTCNGCKLRRYHCSKAWRCEYSAARAQGLADGLLSEARRGANAREEDFEGMMAKIRSDVARGLSPAQIAAGRAGEFRVHPSTVYRWIAAGYGGMSNAQLRRQVGYKPRKSRTDAEPTSHGQERSYAAFSELPEDRRAGACETDTVIGRARDSQCLLTLYLRPCKVQVAMLLPDKTSSAAAAALDTLENALGKGLFQRLFGLVLTDNGAEFSDTEALERSASGGTARCQVYYCDVRQSQQKGGCERNHVELRKLLPKGRGISFDDLDGRDCSVLMSHLNSEPRASLMGLSPLAMLRAADRGAADALAGALGIEEVPYGELDMTVRALNRARAGRGLPPLA